MARSIDDNAADHMPLPAHVERGYRSRAAPSPARTAPALEGSHDVRRRRQKRRRGALVRRATSRFAPCVYQEAYAPLLDMVSAL